MPFVESMMSVLRSNKSIMLDKSSHFKKTSGGYESTKPDLFDFPRATPELLCEIGHRCKKENQKKFNRTMVILVVLILLLITCYIIITKKNPQLKLWI